MFSKNLGPVVLDYGGTELGEVKGEANFKYVLTTVKSTVDKTGEMARAKVISGVECTVTAAISEATLEQLLAVCPGASLSSGTATKALSLQTPIGTDLVESAAILILKPIVDGIASVVAADWIYIPKASVLPVFDVPHKIEEQKVWNVEFEGHPVLAADVATGGALFGEAYVEGDVAVLGVDADA